MRRTPWPPLWIIWLLDQRATEEDALTHGQTDLCRQPAFG
jgi:hypothetical protein